MQIVIEIDKEHYERIMRLDEGVTVYPTTLALYEAVKNATPLPKGHGRLGDLDLLEREMYYNAFATDTGLQKWDSGLWIRYKMFKNVLDKVPTIIEAESGE